jgi:tripartite-type tricarboxylate transporter receptor subunit TctC
MLMRGWLRNAVGRAALVGVIAAVAGGPASAADIRILTPAERGSFAYALIEAMGRHLSDELADQVVVEPVPGDGGARAEQAVAKAAPDGRTLLFGSMLGFEVSAAFGRAPPLSRLTPIAKLASGISLVLIVPASSDIQDFAGFASAAAARPLRLSYAGPTTTAGVARALLVKQLNTTFKDVVRSDQDAITDDVVAGRADAALLYSQGLMTSPAARSGELRPIVSFGAERSGSFNAIMFSWFTGAVPAFNEVTRDPKDDFTDALAVFGPPGLPEGTVKRLVAGFTGAGANPEMQSVAVETGLQVEVHGPNIVTETMDRDARVLERLRPFMER